MKKQKKRIFLLSGADTSDNLKALKHLKKVTSKLKSVTFIPSQKYDSKEEFKKLKKDFKSIGFNKFTLLPLDSGFSKLNFDEALKSDVIYLGGGNTFYFMSYLRKRKIGPALKKYTQNGGILMGISAGAIIMTPNILLAGFPREDADDNENNYSKMKGLNLVNFEVCPHYKNSKKMINDLSAYTSLYQNAVFGLKDKDFIYVEGSQFFLSGKIPMFKNGSEIKLT